MWERIVGEPTVCMRYVMFRAFVTRSEKPKSQQADGCSMWLHSCIAGFVYRCISNDPAVWIHPRVNPRLEGLSDGTKAHGLSRKPVAVLVRERGEDGVTLPFTKTSLILNTCLCLPPSSLVSPWQHCAQFPVAEETLRPLLRHCGNTCYKSPNPISSVCLTQVVGEFLKFLLLFLYKFWPRLFPCPLSSASSLSLDSKAEINLLFPSSSWHLRPFVFAQQSGGFHWAAETNVDEPCAIKCSICLSSSLCRVVMLTPTLPPSPFSPWMVKERLNFNWEKKGKHKQEWIGPWGLTHLPTPSHPGFSFARLPYLSLPLHCRPAAYSDNRSVA